MRYSFKTTLSSPLHPEHGVATIYFPIVRENYDDWVDVLRMMETGDPVKRDCRVDSLDSDYSVLERLEGSVQNLDELDYLAKRLDSFTDAEVAQFQAMAHKLQFTDVKDLINLTFCCQRATVITDFSDLERIGRDHYMNLHDGCVPTRELDDLDGTETAHLLIDGGGATVTPFGVVYDNGMKLEQLYDGKNFPAYLYDGDTVLVVTISPKDEPRDTAHKTYLFLPVADSQVERSMVRAGLRDCDDMRIELEGWQQFRDVFPELHMEYESIRDLNDMATELAQLSQSDKRKLCAAVGFTKPDSAMQIKNLAQQLYLFDLVPGVHTPEEYGKYMIQESGHFEYDANLEGFYDFKKYGQQHIDGQEGQFVSEGYVSYHGTDSIDDLMRGLGQGGMKMV